ncbi:hypothetical protein Q7P37_004562 [Cladosporium fusiforme]
MPGMHISLTSRRLSETPDPTMPQPLEHHRQRRLSQTLTIVTSFKQDFTPRQLRSPSTTPIHQISQEHQPIATPHLRLHNKLRLHPGPPPMRDLPALHKAGEKIHSHRPLVAADQLKEVTPDLDVLSNHVDCSFNNPYGLLYGAGLPHAMCEKARLLAEAEEAEYQSRRSWRRRAKLTHRVGSMLKDILVPGFLWRARSGIR